MPFSLQARFVFPVDRPPIPHGIVTIDSERIVAVGTSSDVTDVIDLGSVALFPGLVNAHTHLEFSQLTQPLGQPGMTLVDWIRLVISERGRRNGDPATAIESGIRESVAGGVTSIGDITTADVSPPQTPRPDLTCFAEVIGFSLARADSAFAAVASRLDVLQESCSRSTANNGTLQPGISPHAPYTVSPKLLQQLVDLASKRNLPMAMHIAESKEELQFLAGGTGPFRDLLNDRSMWDENAIARGSRPMDYLQMLAAAPRSLVIHGNYLGPQELMFLGANRHQMSLVYCPRTHAYFGHEPYPLYSAVGSRVRVALGTDSRASNPDLNLLSEMRHVSRNYEWIAPLDILRMGTLSGAKALGRERDIGSITEGKLASLVAVPIGSESLSDPNDVLSAIFAAETAPYAVYLAGRPRNV